MGILSFFGGLWNGNSTRDSAGMQITQPAANPVGGGFTVTEDVALQVSAVWAAVKLLSEAVGSMPLMVYDVDGDHRTKSTSDLYKILHIKPNSRMTSITFRETMMLNLCMRGNCYARIERIGNRVVALWPLAAQQMNPVVMEDGTLVYEYTRDNNTVIYSDESIMHIKLFGNGTVGMSPISYAANSIGMAMASESYSNKFFKNGGKPSGVLTLDKLLTTDQRKTLRESFSSLVEGPENDHKLMLLEAGMAYQAIQIKPEDMQMIESRKFQVEDIARFFGVPSILINDTGATTTWGAGIEQLMLGFYQLNLKPYLSRWEQAMTDSLLTPAQQRSMQIEFNFDGLLRTDSKGRSEFYSTMSQNGIMTRNECRKKENLSPMDGGDKLTVQLNLTPLDKLGEEQL